MFELIVFPYDEVIVQEIAEMKRATMMNNIWNGTEDSHMTVLTTPIFE